MNSAAMKYLTGCFILLLLFIGYLANSGTGPDSFAFVKYVPGGDKTAHFMLMGMLSFLVNMSLAGAETKIFSLRVLKGSLTVCIVVTLEEISQIFLSSRTFSLGDLACDYMGIYLLGRMAKYLSQTRNC